MYIAVVVLLLLVLPAGSVVAEGLLRGGGDVVALVGKWFVFWGVGVRLFIAGIRQTAQPQFTAVDIFAIEDPRALAIVRELGFANLAVGTLGLLALGFADFRVPASDRQRPLLRARWARPCVWWRAQCQEASRDDFGFLHLRGARRVRRAARFLTSPACYIGAGCWRP